MNLLSYLNLLGKLKKGLAQKPNATFWGENIAWDVAIIPTGPVLVEFNVPDDIDGPQFTDQKCLWDETLSDMLESSDA